MDLAKVLVAVDDPRSALGVADNVEPSIVVPIDELGTLFKVLPRRHRQPGSRGVVLETEAAQVSIETLPGKKVDETITIDVGGLRSFGRPDLRLAVSIEFIERNRHT